jgi:hypothetical protein
VETEHPSIGVKERRDWQGPEEAKLGRVAEKRIQIQGGRIIDMTIDSYFLISDLDVFQKR